MVNNGDSINCNELRQSFEDTLGSPGKWQFLFDADGHLIRSLADRVTTDQPEIDNPLYEKAHERGKPDTVYIDEKKTEWPTVPVLHDWLVLKIFEEAHCFGHVPRFYLAGEPRTFRLDPTQIHIGILVAGGNAAGLNMVVDSIVKRLTALASEIKKDASFRPKIYGYVGGFEGLKSSTKYVGAHGGEILTIEDTDPHAGEPCIFLKTLRGPRFDDLESPEARAEIDRLAKAVQRDELDVLFVIGGNGTFTWASKIYKRVQEVNPKFVLVGGPKTMDWDINFADATFGFRTAVDKAMDFIRTAHWEAKSQDRIAIIELFGARSGFVALHSGFLSGEADVIMIREFEMSNEALVERVRDRLFKRDHAVIVVAEGALRDFKHGSQSEATEKFTAFAQFIKGQFPRHGLVDIRPRHLIRGTEPCSFDLDLAKYSGYLMADTALAGFTNCSVQLWQNSYSLVPIATAVARLGEVQRWSPYYWYMAQRYLLPK